MDKHFAIAIDTSGRVGSVAVGSGEKVICSSAFSGQMRHAAELFPTILELVSGAGKNICDITDVYVTNGPGSFTGLRIAITVAKMMALASDVKIATVSSLDCVAMNAIDYINEQNNKEIESVVALIDAKRGQFFNCLYNKEENWDAVTPETMKTAEQILEMIGTTTKTLINGEALKYYQDKFAQENVEFADEERWGIKAENVYKSAYKKALKGQYDNPETLLPKYLRLSDAEENLLKRESKV
ncbi:MAG: tRNA (adenosine(37)-N6)-threonylcarbamoyltransferase complex dimerization subunit type 1 TsaB [Sedimentisphaeraceae bacterium JB056]